MRYSFFLASMSFFILLVLASCGPAKRQGTATFTGDVFDDTHLHEIRLYFKESNFWDSLVFFKKQKDSLEINHYSKCDVSMDGVDLKDVGIRLKGESSYDFTKTKKKSFKLDYNCYVKKQKMKGIRRINLNNNYKDPSLLREKLALDIMAKAGLPSPRSAFAKVYINDEYWGLYLMVEAVNKEFLKKNFGEASGNLYFGEPNGTLEKLAKEEDYQRSYRKKNNKKKNEWSDLIQFVTVLNGMETEQKQEADLDSIFKLDACMKIWAVNNLLVNVDAYNLMYPHNYFLYHDTSSKKLNWINYDYNYSFAAWNPKFNYKEVCDLSVYYHNEKFPLAEAILKKNSALKKRYTAIVQQVMERVLDENAIAEIMNKQQALIREAVKEDKNMEFTFEEFEKNSSSTLGDKMDPGAYYPGILEFVRDRKTSVLKELNTSKTVN